ncbi:uncharacterized protein EURHEDRAFT_376589 [Aspergillus ruber CBS 135680]|uniref:Uncharacterized protein n=1 Tax=Aspergillus ruber (strain CBS 135680) TaxID=1388766 RepID=A0A017SH59_ASPRC|nr:uncharacterized protein EURHEDRAFT_376589 [Aspergillus ruber CBS 135680]EYE96056.1 hypothetical protein EURHEDRAFT_376589 [Aspergillus ruber CBS 135680]
MQPNHYDLLGQVRNESRSMTRDDYQPLHENALQSRSPSGAAPSRTEDSWIEVASQPSSSSLSSANDDIITTGLRVQQQGSSRSRSQRHVAITTQNGYSSRDASSSQDEYEESESESDRVLSSSNEEINRKPPSLQQNRPSPSTLDAASSDDDDNSTALGTRVSTSRFVPQPNVFSHPPASRNPSWTRAMDTRRPEPSEASNSSRRTAIRMNSQASMRSNRSARQNQQHSPFNMLSPSHQADHDAALRASLSTLLSCAAAARGLPKSETQQLPTDPPRQQASSFRLVPESAMDSGDEEASPAAVERNTAGPVPRKHPISGPSYPSEAAPAPKKRRSSSPRGAGNQAASRKSRRSILNESLSVSSPTVMTWVVSAGVVVLFSAISFSAGYMLGREVGRMEMGPGMAGDGSGTTSTTCGQQAVKGGLKRFRWGSSAAGSGILA